MLRTILLACLFGSLCLHPGCQGSIERSDAGLADSGPADGDSGTDRDGDGAVDGADGSEPGDAGGGDAGGGDAGDDAGGGDAGGGDAGGDPGGDGGGPVTILFSEPFEDDDFESRGWYDAPSGDLSSAEHIAGSTRSFECFFEQGQRGCRGGTPGRLQFEESESVYLSYWVKYSENYVGSQRPYHPHEFHFVTNQDDRWVGPAYSHLTTYTEQVGGVVRIALQDSRNNDPDCILLNNDSFVGCDGDFDSYVFSEARSVCSCNGLIGDLEGRDCFNAGSYYYSARSWDSPQQMFRDEQGPYYKNDWHFIESYFEMNSIQGGVGIPDGVIQVWYDGELILDHHRILMRSGQHPDMRFNQFIIAPYIGDGSPVDQVMWIDDLVLATKRP